jgi:alkanesulfonate monooxygenase SsuD/methylene tetrahydromethanopterin reductase-like flavin-dependent oxidoreductase (luciferase family)
MFEPQEGLSTQEIVSWAEFAERTGYGYLFRSDHLLPTSGIRSGVESPECWVTLGALAAKTRKIKFGPMVSPVGFRNPALLARMACTLHTYSGGRFQLGLGAGWYEPEYITHGLEFPGLGIRRRQLIEALNIVRCLTEGRRIDYDGKYFTAHVECFPKPIGGKIHLILGGRSAKVVQTTCEFADEWNIFASPDKVVLKLEGILRSSRRKIEISQTGPFIIAESKRELDTRIRRLIKMKGIDGTPAGAKKKLEQYGIFCGLIDDFVSQVNKRREMGIEKFYFQILFPEEKAMIETLTDTLKRRF